VDGYENALWIALDYGDVIVHVFQPETRAFYSIETLWEDAEVAEIPELS
jgi:ribosome-associated protein